MTERNRRRESQHPDWTAAHRSSLIACLRQFVEKRFDPGKIKSPGFSGREVPGRTLEEAEPDLPLQLSDGPRNRRGIGVAIPRDPCETAPSRDLDEYPEKFYVHVANRVAA